MQRLPPFVSACCALLMLASAPAAAQSFTEMVAMRDGVHLATDVYLPSGSGPWPTILFRTPYGKDHFSDRAATYVGYGVAVVSQDMRGRFDSEGVDQVFSADGDGALKDGYDTIAWLTAQTWSNGVLGTSGGSANGIVQYMQTSTAPPGLAVVNPVVATPSMYEHAMFYGGVFRQSMVVGWLQAHDSTHFLDEIAAHPYEDAFWDPVQTADRYGVVTAAGLHEGGWYDIFLQGNIDGFVGYQHQGGPGAAGQQKLIIGPWTHGGLYQTGQGELDYPANASSPPYPEAFNTMFNHYLGLGLSQISDTPDDVPNVQYYVMGDVDDPAAPGNVWRTADDWPPVAAPVRLHLQPGGGLAEVCPPSSSQATAYVSDPNDPSPTVCGANLNLAAGPCDQSAVESRDDVVVFETGLLTSPHEVTGRVRAHLFVDIDRTDADLMVRMTDVYPDGRSMLIADGAARLAARGSTTGLSLLSPGEVVEAVVDLWSTSIVINSGHRLRISISSTNSPRFAANQNNGLDYPEAITSPGGPVTVQLHHDLARASYLEVPDPGRGPQDFVSCRLAVDAGAADTALPVDSGAAGDVGVAGDAAAVMDALFPDATMAPDAGVVADVAGVRADAGDGDPAVASCGCGATRREQALPLLALMFLAWRRSSRRC